MQPKQPHLLRTGVAALLIMAVCGTGCHVVQTTANLPGRAVSTITPGQPKAKVVDPVEVQQTLLRFADGFSAQVIAGVNHLGEGTNGLAAPAVLRLKIALVTETTAIATGPNSIANLLDMTTFITVMRMSLENHWEPKVFGASAQRLVAVCRSSEAEIWRIAGGILTSNQLVELQAAIESWQVQNPAPETILGARALELSTLITKGKQPSGGNPGNVFSLLMLDPLAGMDPAVREIAQTRLFAERALYLTQKMPSVLRWQAELMSLNATQIPAVQELVTNITQVSATLDRFAAVAEQLPAQVSAEREEILKALQAQEKGLNELLTTGTDMSDSLNTTLKTFDGLMARFGVGETNQTAAPDPNAEPFRIQDYTETAVQLAVTAGRLTELLNTLDHTLGSTNLAALTDQVAPAVAQAEASGKAVVDYAFWRGTLFAFLIFLGALVYRLAVKKML